MSCHFALTPAESGQLSDTAIDRRVAVCIIRVAYAEVTRMRCVAGSAGREDECVLGDQFVEKCAFIVAG